MGRNSTQGFNYEQTNLQPYLTFLTGVQSFTHYSQSDFKGWPAERLQKNKKKALETLYKSQFTLSTQLVKLKLSCYTPPLPRHSTLVSLETYTLY